MSSVVGGIELVAEAKSAFAGDEDSKFDAMESGLGFLEGRSDDEGGAARRELKKYKICCCIPANFFLYCLPPTLVVKGVGELGFGAYVLLSGTAAASTPLGWVSVGAGVVTLVTAQVINGLKQLKGHEELNDDYREQNRLLKVQLEASKEQLQRRKDLNDDLDRQLRENKQSMIILLKDIKAADSDLELSLDDLDDVAGNMKALTDKALGAVKQAKIIADQRKKALEVMQREVGELEEVQDQLEQRQEELAKLLKETEAIQQVYDCLNKEYSALNARHSELLSKFAEIVDGDSN